MVMERRVSIVIRGRMRFWRGRWIRGSVSRWIWLKIILLIIIRIWIIWARIVLRILSIWGDLGRGLGRDCWG